MRFKDVRIYQKHIPEDAISDLVKYQREEAGKALVNRLEKGRWYAVRMTEKEEEQEQEWIGQTSIERSCMIDIEPLITCKECKHYTSEYRDAHFGLGFCLFINSPCAHHQGFCAWGERND